MADKGLIEKSTLDSIAAAIRTMNGKSTKYQPSAMAAAIKAISTGVKMATGTFTVSDTTTTFYTVTHGLGAVPNIAIVIRLRGSSRSAPTAYFIIKDGTGKFITDNTGTLSEGSSIKYGLSEVAWDASTVKFGGYSGTTSTKFRGDYMWLAGVI